MISSAVIRDHSTQMQINRAAHDLKDLNRDDATRVESLVGAFAIVNEQGLVRVLQVRDALLFTKVEDYEKFKHRPSFDVGRELAKEHIEVLTRTDEITRTEMTRVIVEEAIRQGLDYSRTANYAQSVMEVLSNPLLFSHIPEIDELVVDGVLKHVFIAS